MAKKGDSADSSSQYTVSSNSPRTLNFKFPRLKRSQSGNFQYASRKASIVGILLILLVAIAGGFIGSWLQDREDETLGASSLNHQRNIVSSQSELISQIAKTVGPSVVSVNVKITSSSDSGQDPFGLFGIDNQNQSVAAAGTGIIISSKGIIMTNRHVVPAGTTNVSITLSDGTELKNVSVIGRTGENDNLDVAFLKVTETKGHKLVPASIGNSSTVEVGDNVVAIGNALGQFQNTVTSGIISGFGRSVRAGDGSGNSSASESLDDLFQTDAAINEGNSGGPLVNLYGQVIGINTAIASNSQSVGFAIPIDDVSGLISQVLKSGKFERPYLGVRYIPLTADVASSFDLKINKGAFIAPSDDPAHPSILSGSPAEKAGLKDRDVITKVDSASVDQNHSLTGILSKLQPGDKVRLTVWRDGKSVILKATLGALPVTETQG